MGWADAEGSVGFLARRCVQAGVSFVTGERGTVAELVTAPWEQWEVNHRGAHVI